ncbi:Hypothetical predicted protein [Mytilus galloprovincialis]|nr:Hypothetical predicted protein [Mytilus galloprovincialis]
MGFRLLPNQASSTNCYSDSGASPANNIQWIQALVMCAMTTGAYLWRPNTVQEAAAVRNEFNFRNANVVVGTDCVGIQFNGATWVWRDQLCANAHRYICEYPRRVCP